MQISTSWFKFLTKFFLILFLWVTSVAFVHAQTDEFKVAYDIYPGNIGYFLMNKKLGKDQPTFLEKRMRETGGKVKMVLVKDYVASIQALAAGQYDARPVAMVDGISGCVNAGVDVSFYTITDYSNGNDGIIVPKGWKLENMKGKVIIGDAFTNLEMLFRRWLELNGKPRDYLVFKNIRGEEAAKIFLAALGAKDELACITWNPNMIRLLETGKAEKIFSTANTPGEIVNGIMIRNDRVKGREKSIQAFVQAYYDAMEYYRDPKTHERALRAAASEMGFSEEELSLFKKIMDEEVFFTKEESLRFIKSKQFARSKEIALDFFKESGALKNKNLSATDIKVDTRFLE